MIFRRNRRERAATGRRGWWERSLFSVMGPPQLGAHAAPAGFTPDPQAELCHRCGRPWTAHERVHTGSITYRRCPDAAS